MRDILFRGKRAVLFENSGQWIEGLLCYNIYHQLCIQPFKNGTVCVIDPDTVGQFIGETDQNGKKIFEGDIVSNKVFRSSVEFYKGRFMPFCGEHNIFNADESEVIGNIYDNPELLKGAKKMENQLKPCPFCGGKAELHNCMEFENEKLALIYSGQSGVHCTECHCATIPYNSEDEAAEAWNRRVENG